MSRADERVWSPWEPYSKGRCSSADKKRPLEQNSCRKRTRRRERSTRRKARKRRRRRGIKRNEPDTTLNKRLLYEHIKNLIIENVVEED